MNFEKLPETWKVVRVERAVDIQVFNLLLKVKIILKTVNTFRLQCIKAKSRHKLNKFQ